MKDTLNIVVMDENELNNLKKRIHNQRKTLTGQHNEITKLKTNLTDSAETEIAYEYSIEDLANRHNKLAKENDDLQKQNTQLKRKLVAVNHAVNGKLHVALR